MKFVTDCREWHILWSGPIHWWSINLPTHCIACSHSPDNILHSVVDLKWGYQGWCAWTSCRQRYPNCYLFFTWVEVKKGECSIFLLRSEFKGWPDPVEMAVSYSVRWSEIWPGTLLSGCWPRHLKALPFLCSCCVVDTGCTFCQTHPCTHQSSSEESDLAPV